MLMHELKAQETFKRALEIAATGGHILRHHPLDGTAYGFDPAMLNHPECREIWDRFKGKPWSEEAAKSESTICGNAQFRLWQEVGNGPELPGELHVSIQPLSWADRVLPPPAEPHSAIVERIQRSRERLPATPAELTCLASLALLKGWQGYYPDRDPAPRISVARTIAAMAGAAYIGRAHLAEALSYMERV